MSNASRAPSPLLSPRRVVRPVRVLQRPHDGSRGGDGKLRLPAALGVGGGGPAGGSHVHRPVQAAGECADWAGLCPAWGFCAGAPRACVSRWVCPTRARPPPPLFSSAWGWGGPPHQRWRLLLCSRALPSLLSPRRPQLVLRIDDPLDSSAIHFGGGALGVLMVGFFARPDFAALLGPDKDPRAFACGGVALSQDDGGLQLGMQVLGACGGALRGCLGVWWRGALGGEGDDGGMRRC